MKELKIFGVVAVLSLITYWGVEPFAHSQMHKHVEGHDFKYDGSADIEEAKAKIEEAKVAKRGVAEAEAKLSAKKTFWADVARISKINGNATAGKATFAMCASCHNGSSVNMGGVIPPKLDHAGALYDKNYLVALIKDPAMASNVDHKYADPTKMHPMAAVKGMVSTDQQIADVVAYLKAEKAGKVTSKVAYEEACGRCHANRYGKLTPIGATPANFKTEKEEYAHKLKVIEEQEKIQAYMGKLPPDLSIMIRARGEHFLETFVENPQSQLAGTSMPRVGLSHDGFEEVKAYLEETGDNHKEERSSLGIWVIAFFVVFTILAYLWKDFHWRDLH